MKITTIMVIFTLFSLGCCLFFTNSEDVKKLRNPLLAPLGDDHSNLSDINQHFADVARDYFGLEFAPQSNLVDSFYKFYDLNEDLIAADSHSFRLNAKETSEALLTLYEQSLPELKEGRFDSFFEKAILIQRKNLAYLLGENLKQNKIIEELTWSSSIYNIIGDNFSNATRNSELVSLFKQGIVQLLSHMTKDAMLYMSYERVIKQTNVELLKEVQLQIDNVMLSESPLDEAKLELLKVKTVFVTRAIAELEGQDESALYYEIARYLINNRVILYKKALSKKTTVIRPDLNQWALVLIDRFLKILVKTSNIDAAFELVQKMLAKELPYFVNRKSFGKKLIEIPEIESFFKLQNRSADPLKHLFKTFVVNTLILSGDSEFFTQENKLNAINAFSELAYASFSLNSFLHNVSPLMFNNVVAAINSAEFTVALFKNVASAAISAVVNPNFTNAYEVLNQAIEEENEESPSKFYVPAKVATFLIAQRFNKNFDLSFNRSDQVIRKFKEALNSDEFSNLDDMVRHWWARQSSYNVLKSQLEEQKYAEDLISISSLKSNSFHGIVKVTATEEHLVFHFVVENFTLNFIEENIPQEADNEHNIESPLPQKENELPERLDTTLNRGQRNGPKNKHLKGQMMEEENVEADETRANQNNGQEARKNIVNVLTGSLNPDELQFLVDSKDLVESLKNGISFLGEDGIPVEITYTQVVNYGSDCHEAIKASLDK